MKLHQLIKLVARPKKRLGRGLGSGKGKTGGRGTKGQKARGKIPAGFTGNSSPLYKKLPLRRGQGNSKVSRKPAVINLSKLETLTANSVVDMELLFNNGIISKNNTKTGVKILGQGELTKALIVKLPVSVAAQEKIEKAGGKIENA